MRTWTLKFLTSVKTSLQAQLRMGVSSVTAWTSDRSLAIAAAVCVVVFFLALILPHGWTRGSGEHIRINLIDFFIRGVVVPELLFFVALIGSRMVRISWIPGSGVLCASTSWYFGVLASSAWLFFVEHVEGTIATTFGDVLTTARLASTIEVVAAPLSLLGSTFDAVLMVNSASSSGALGSDVAVMWRNFVLLSLLVYAIAPRLILLGTLVISTTLARAAKATTQRVAGWKPEFARPLDSSLDWFEQTEDEQQLTKALTLTALVQLPATDQSPAVKAHIEQLSSSLADNWKRLMADEPTWQAYLSALTPDLCPKIRSIGFDAARYNFAAEDEGEGYALAPQVLSKVLGTVIARGKGWGIVHAALGDVVKIEKDLGKDSTWWKKWFLIAGAGVGAAAGAVVLAPVLGTASLVALGGGAIAKGGLGILGGKLILAAAGGSVGAAAGATLPLTKEATSQLFVQIIARQIALLSHSCVPRPAAATVAAWLQDVVAANSDTKDSDAKMQERTAKRALKLLRERSLIV